MSQIVRCPKCNSAVSVGPNQGGQRLQCPSCLQQFIAPMSVGAGAGATSEDEDWLSLDEETSTAGTNAIPNPISTAPISPAEPLPPLKLDDDVELIDDVELTDDLELMPGDSPGQSTSPPPDFSDTPGFPGVESSRADDNLFANLPSMDMGGQPQSTPAMSNPSPPGPDYLGEPESQESFRVKCPICESILYAKPHQSGGTIRCSDCHGEVRVPKPPRKRSKPKNQPEAATFQLSEAEDNRRPDPFKKSAEELLQKAAEPDDERKIKPPYEVPNVKGWLLSVFGIFLDLGVIFYFGLLCTLLAVPAAIIAWQPIFTIGMIPLAIIGTVLTVSCGFAILQSVANDHETVEDWPGVDPNSWSDSLGMVLVATAVAVGPTFALSRILQGTPAISIALVMLGVYTLFPFLLLSMMDLQSVTGLFSADVTKSVTRCQEDWGTFYFSSGMTFGLLMSYFLFISYTPATIAFGVALTIAVIFLYFAMLGRLAQAIGGEAALGGLDEAETEEAT